MNLKLNLQASDFFGLLSRYADDGLKTPIENAVVAAIERSIAEQFGESLIKAQACVSVSDDATYRAIVENRGLQVDINNITFDLEKNSNENVSCIELSVGVTQGFRSYGGFEPSPIKITTKNMATRDRYKILSSSLFISAEFFDVNQKDIRSCKCPISMLRPVLRHPMRSHYTLWRCICCENLFLCECSRGVPEYYAERPGYDNSPTITQLELSSYRPGACHFCRDIPSTTVYRSQMYGSRIKSLYEPYINELMVKDGLDHHDAENAIRDRLGIPRIGEQWLSEAHLYHTVRQLYPDYNVLHQGSPEWLGRQRFDIYLPEVSVAVEYQGEQHFFPIDRFGGQSGLIQTRERDARKKRRADRAGVVVVEFKYDEELSEKLITDRIDRAIDQAKKIIGQ